MAALGEDSSRGQLGVGPVGPCSPHSVVAGAAARSARTGRHGTGVAAPGDEVKRSGLPGRVAPGPPHC